MKKLIVILAMVSTSAFAQHHGHRGNGHGWIGPVVIGAALGYVASQQLVYRTPGIIPAQVPEEVYNKSYPVYNLPTPPPYYGAVRLYERRFQYDSQCNCYVVIYNQIGWQ